MKPIARFTVVARVYGIQRSVAVVDTSNNTQVRCFDRQQAETYAAMRNAQEGTSR